MITKEHFQLKKLIQIVLSLSFIFNLFISEISNYKPSSFYLKTISSLTLLLIAGIDYKLNRNEFRNTTKLDVKPFIIVVSLFVLILAISLTYSYNIEFGIMKMGYLFISVIPLVFIFQYFLVSASRIRIYIFLHTLLFIGVLFGATSLLFSPYNQVIGYSFEFSRWSHVIAGRFLSSVIVVVLLLHFTNFLKSKIVLIVTTTILLVSTYFVGMRAAFLGIIILIATLILYAVIKKNKRALLSISFTLLFSIASVLLINQFNNTSTERYNKLLTNKVGKFDDGAINARLIAYDVSWQNIKKYPVLGIGFGGFYNKKISGDIAEIKYPHNLLFEIQLELGIFGTIFFGVLFVLIFWRAYKFSIPLFVFLVFSFWLAMFSKDIATQTQLWIGIAVVGLKGGVRERLREKEMII